MNKDILPRTLFQNTSNYIQVSLPIGVHSSLEMWGESNPARVSHPSPRVATITERAYRDSSIGSGS